MCHCLPSASFLCASLSLSLPTPSRVTPTTAVGLAFSCQLVESVPVDGHDQSVDFVASPDGIFRAEPRW